MQSLKIVLLSIGGIYLLLCSVVFAQEVPGIGIIAVEDARLIEGVPVSFTGILQVDHMDESLRAALISAGIDSIRRLGDRPIPDYRDKQLTVRDILGLPPITMANMVIAKWPTARGSTDVRAALDTVSKVVSFTPGFITKPNIAPNDYDYVSGFNWGFRSSNYYGIGAEVAWSIETGDPNVAIAVLDNGFYIQNDDFGDAGPYGKVQYVNASPIQPPAGEPSRNHGTSVAGIAAGLTNNYHLPNPNFSGLSAGIAGGWSYDPIGGTGNKGCRLWLYKTDHHSWEDIGSLYNLIGSNVRVVNYSNGFCDIFGLNHSFIEAVWEAYINDVLFVAAMGNTDIDGCEEGDPLDTQYPAGYKDIVFAVGATDGLGQRVRRSLNYNWESAVGFHIDAVAPGTSHRALWDESTSGYFSGTSCSAPMVSGSAALLYSLNQSLQMRDVENLLKLTATDVTPTIDAEASIGYDIYTGHGIIDVGAAMKAITFPNAVDFYTAANGTAIGGIEDQTWRFIISNVYRRVDRVEVRKQITFPRRYYDPPLVWGRHAGSTGAAPTNPNYELYWTGVVEGSVTETGCELVSYVYHIDGGDNHYPCRAEEVVFSYAVAGEVELDNPASLTVTPNYAADNCVLNWDDKNPNEQGTVIIRKVGLNGIYAIVDTVGPNIITWTDDALAALTGTERIYYKVYPYIETQWMPQYSPEASFVNGPNPPRNVAIAPELSGSDPTQVLNLSWQYPLNQNNFDLTYDARIYYPSHNETFWFRELTGYSIRFCAKYLFEPVVVTMFSVDPWDRTGRPSAPVSTTSGRMDVCCYSDTMPVHDPAKGTLAQQSLPTDFELRQNYPNPFNLSTAVTFEVPHNADVAVTIHNSLGELVTTLADSPRPPGIYTLSWDGRGVDGREISSGVYFVRMRAGSFESSRKMVLLK